MTDYRMKSLESEQALIGAALMDGSWLTETDLTPAEFLNADNRTIWAAILEVHKRNEPVDLITVNSELQAAGLNWVAYLSEVSRNTPSTANWQGYEAALRRHALAAKSDRILREGLEDLGHGKQVADRVISDLMQIDQTGQDYDISIKQAMGEAVNLIERVMKGEETTITTGLSELDGALGGFHDTDLIVIAARPAMGKTALLLNMLAANRLPLGLISGEQPREQIGLRLMAIRSGVPIHNVRTGKLDQMQSEQLTQASADLSQRNVFINDRPGITIQDVRRQARRWKHRHGVKALYLDYIQKIKATDTNVKRHEQVGEVVSGLKDLAKELRIPVVALAQVGRQVEARPNKRPHMGDISDSSEIEKEADQIITLYRDEVYNADTPDRGLMELDVCKNRHGPTGCRLAVWVPDSMRVRDPDMQTKNNWLSRGAA